MQTKAENLTLVTAAKEEPATKKRSQFFGVFIGTNRTGKSSTARRYAEAWRKHNPNGKVMALDPQNSFIGLIDETIELDNKQWDTQICTLRNGLLILDDFRLVQDSGNPKPGLKKLMAYRAKWNVDIIMICHSPSLVLLFTTAFITHYYIFRTQALANSFSTRIPEAERCIKASTLMNEYYKLHGGGTYPRFSHIIITNQDEFIYPQNMDIKKLNEIVNRLY